jgi:hypothetical protein
VNILKQAAGYLLTAVFIALIILSTVSTLGEVSAQTDSFSITQVDHQVQIMSSGNVVIFDTIYVSGQIPDDFKIGLPYQYSTDVLKVLAYDEKHVYDIKLGLSLDDHSGFYGVEVNFDGKTPATFTVAFVLSNRLVTETESGNYILDFPAYPSLTQSVKICNVNIMFPKRPTAITISKADGTETGINYVKTDLPAYSYSTAQANTILPFGTLQIATINSLNHQITIDATGIVTAEDTYHITSNSVSSLSAFVLSLPPKATNVIVKDQSGETLSAKLTEDSGILLASVVFGSFISQGQTTSLTVKYSLPGAVLQNTEYVLGDFKVFPDLLYLVEHAITVFSFPEGATLVLPKVTALDVSATLTRNIFQDILTIEAENVSYVDYLAHQQSTVGLAYNYNPVWISFKPTFLAVFAALIGCIIIAIYRIYKSREETYENRAEKIAAVSQQGYEAKPDQQMTVENIKDFVDTYEAKRQLKAELKSLDAKAQKGKIQRQQYKVQKKTIETHIEGLIRNIERKKGLFRGASGIYPDLIIQIELAEADLAESERSIENLEILYGKGEISRENYKQSIGDYQKVHDKAEAAIKRILFKLREKTR